MEILRQAQDDRLRDHSVVVDGMNMGAQWEWQCRPSTVLTPVLPRGLLLQMLQDLREEEQ